MIGTNVDITELKQAEFKIKRQQRLLDTTGRIAMVGGWEFDAQKLDVSWTKETYHIFEIASRDQRYLQYKVMDS